MRFYLLALTLLLTACAAGSGPVIREEIQKNPPATTLPTTSAPAAAVAPSEPAPVVTPAVTADDVVQKVESLLPAVTQPEVIRPIEEKASELAPIETKSEK
jgi:hypothetical protein